MSKAADAVRQLEAENEALRAALKEAKGCFHRQVALCHDMKAGMARWSRPDPTATLMECYATAAVGIGHCDKALGIKPPKQEREEVSR